MEDVLNLRLWRGPLGPKRETSVPIREGAKLDEYVPDSYEQMRVVAVKHNGNPVDDARLKTITPKSGDTLSLMPIAGWELLLAAGISLVIGILLKIGEYNWQRYEQKRKEHQKQHAAVGPTYAFEIMQNTYSDGASIPVVMGRHRTGGIVLQQFTDSEEEGIDRQNTLIAQSQGPINGISDAHIDGNLISNYANAILSTRLGTNDQTTIDGFRDSVGLIATSQQLLADAPIVIIGNAIATRAKIKINFPQGVYHIDGSGDLHGINFIFQVERRPTSGGAWVEMSLETFRRRRTTPFSIFRTYDLPSAQSWDIRITRRCPNQQGRDFYDAWIREYQQITDDGIRYQGLALSGLQAVGQTQLSGNVGRYTTLVEGVLPNAITSATLAGAPTWSRNPAENMLLLLYNREWGLGNEIDSTVRLTVTNTALSFTVGETIKVSAVDDFIGKVLAWDGATDELILEVFQGFPHGTLDGLTSTKSADVVSIDECYGVNFPAFKEYKDWCDSYVPDGSGVETNVGINSPVGTSTLFVDDVTGFSADDWIVIDFEGDRAEQIQIDSIGAGLFILKTNLQFTHTLAQADLVQKAEKRAFFDFVYDGNEDGWGALMRIAKVSRAMIIRASGNFINVRPWSKDAPVQLVCQGNVKTVGSAGEGEVSSFKMDFPETGPRPNRMTAWYADETRDYLGEPASRDAPELQSGAETKIFPVEMELYGSTRRSQTLREAWWRLKQSRYGSDPIQFLMGLECIDFEAGDRFEFQHDVPGAGLAGGRVLSATNSTVTFTNPLPLPAGTNVIKIRHQNDVKEAQVITSPQGEYKTISIFPSVWTNLPQYGEPFAIYQGDLAIYRCISVRMNEDLQAEVMAIEDPDSVYSEDFGTLPVFTPTTLPDPNQLPPDVENLALQEARIRGPQQQVTSVIDVHFTRPEHPSYSHAEIWLREKTQQLFVVGANDWAPGNGNQEFDHPRGVCIDTVNNLVFVADERNHRVLKLNLRDLSYVGEFGTFGTGPNNLMSPFDVCTDGTYLFVLDPGNHRISVRLVSTLAAVTQFGTRGSGNGQFLYPSGICTDDGSNLWVADAGNHRVQRFTVTVGVPAYAAQVGTQGTGNLNFDFPVGIDVDSAPTYFLVADSRNHRLKKHDALGAMGFVSEVGSFGIGDDNFKFPMDVAIKDDWSVLWACDRGNHRIHKRDGVSPHGLQRMMGGTASGIGRDEYDGPRGIAHIESNTFGNNLYITEYGNNRVQIRTDGTTDTEDWNWIDDTSELSFRINRGISPGEAYEVSVVSVSPNEVKKDPADGVKASITLSGVGGAPPSVANLYVTNINGDLRLHNDTVVAFDLAGFEYRVGADWASSTLIGRTNRDTPEIMLPRSGFQSVGGSGTYLVKAFTTSRRQYSPVAASKTYNNPGVAALAGATRTFNPFNQRTGTT